MQEQMNDKTDIVKGLDKLKKNSKTNWIEFNPPTLYPQFLSWKPITDMDRTLEI